ncbi:MAG: adenine phosphoribosyltransferase [Candidatus Cloacimonadota bacterium]|nr:MAG: adenine phosphoribosyltransferase [Candidatus Cloacimonadota bacterium]
MTEETIKKHIRNVTDFPKKGIVFRDITTLLLNGSAFHETVNLLLEELKDKRFDKFAAIEARGFVFGGALANLLRKGIILVRKPGKLCAETVRVEYELEYGIDALEMHKDAVKKGDKIVVIDDLLATGGTALSTCRLVEKLGGDIVELVFLVELSFLSGREKLKGYPVYSIIDYATE